LDFAQGKFLPKFNLGNVSNSLFIMAYEVSFWDLLNNLSISFPSNQPVFNTKYFWKNKMETEVHIELFFEPSDEKF